ncbi:MAG: hypothetical protein ACO1N1_15500 [Dyadobacter fermentans]
MKKTIIAIMIFAGAVCMNACSDHQHDPSAFDKVYNSVNDPENEYFWEQFHSGNISNVKTMISRLEKQYAGDSTNVVVAAHLGFANFWVLSEGMRSTQPLGSIPDYINNAYKYFGRAYQLNTNDKRILGFLSNAEMAWSSLQPQPGPVQQSAMQKGQESIAAWPEFNKFTIGIGYTSLPPQADAYKYALELQWTTLEDCYTSPIDRSNPNIRHILNRDLSGHNLGKDRACYNNWLAPHNIEGYFLNMGDMIVKTGDHAMAVKIYELAKASPDYNNWVFKDVLEKRITNAQQNTVKFLDETQQGIDNVMIAGSGALCMSCHQMSEGDKLRYKDFDWKKYFRETDVYSVKGL